VGDGVAAAEEVGRAEPRVRVEVGGVGRVHRPVLAVVRIVEDDGAAGESDLVVDQTFGRGDVVSGEGVFAAALGQDDLTVAGQLEVFGDGEGVGEGDEHALEGFEVGVDGGGRSSKVAAGDAGHGQLDGRRCGQGVARAEHGDASGCRSGELAHAKEVTGGAGDAN